MVKKIKYLISTHIDYYGSTIDRLINSLLQSGISIDDLFIVVGGASDSIDDFMFREIQTVFTQNNSFDLNAFIECIKQDLFIDYDYVFLLHDTCEVGVNFKTKVESFIDDDTVTIPLFSDFSSCNIGIYKRDYISSLKDIIHNYENKTKLFYVEKEDCFLRNHLHKKQSFSKNTKILGIENVYSDSVQREINLCEEIELYKYKANWYIKEWTVKP